MHCPPRTWWSPCRRATKAAVGRVVVPFRITVPANASPGDHGAAIVAVLSTLGKNPKGENVRLDQRVASRIYLRVNGPLHPGLRIEGLSVTYRHSLNPLHGGSATVRYTVHNVGNVRLAAQADGVGDRAVRYQSKVVDAGRPATAVPGCLLGGDRHGCPECSRPASRSPGSP